MKTFAAFLLLVCSGMAFGQDVTIDHIELTQTMIEGVDDLTIAAELVNNHHEAITVRDASFSLVSQGGDTFESYVGTNETDGINFALGERINPGVTADHMLFFRVPSTINLHEPLKLRLGDVALRPCGRHATQPHERGAALHHRGRGQSADKAGGTVSR
jgi:hypothetical protein